MYLIIFYNSTPFNFNNSFAVSTESTPVLFLIGLQTKKKTCTVAAACGCGLRGLDLRPEKQYNSSASEEHSVEGLSNHQ